MLQTFSINSWIINVSCILRFANYPIKYSRTLTLNKTTMGLVLLILCIKLILCTSTSFISNISLLIFSKEPQPLTHSFQMQYKSKIINRVLQQKQYFKQIPNLWQNFHLWNIYLIFIAKLRVSLAQGTIFCFIYPS